MEDLQKLREMIERIDFTIPNNTSSKYYLNAMQAMIEKGCNVSFEDSKVYIWDESGSLYNGIQDIECFFGGPKSKVGLFFKIHILQNESGLEIENMIEANSFKPGILSEREQLSFMYGTEFYRYDYLREYEMDGTCIFHNSKDLAQRLLSSAKLYDKGLLISLFNIKDNERKSIIIPGDFSGDRKKHISFDIKKGRIFELINAPEGKEVPYKPYPCSDAEFEKLLLKI